LVGLTSFGRADEEIEQNLLNYSFMLQ